METSPVERPTRRLNFAARLALAFVLLAILASLTTLTISYINFRRESRATFRQRLLDLVTLAALQQDGDAFDTIRSPRDAEFERVRLQNIAIRRSSPDIRYVFTARFDDQGLYFVVDAGEIGEEGIAAYGERYEDPGPVLAANYRTLSEAMVEEDFYTDVYGTFLSAYAPITNSQGQLVGIIGVDFTADKVLEAERNFLLINLALFAALLPLLGLMGWALGNALARPIQALTEATARIAAGDLSYQADIRSNIPELRLLGDSFEAMAGQLREMVSTLEARVAARTEELTSASLQLARRAAQFEAIAQVAKTVASIQDLNTLLNRLVVLISNLFGFYHAGIFLVDENREYANLLAANSEGGRRMIERGHRLQVGKIGIVGYVAATGRARIASNVGADAVHFRNPDLPDTQSEMALPLRVGRETIGVLDIQSKEQNAFSEEDAAVFATLADQIAIAIQNARSFEQSQRLLLEAQRAVGGQIQKAWEALQASAPRVGYRVTGSTVKRLDQPLQTPQIEQAVLRGETVAARGGKRAPASLAVPLRLRGEVIGVMNIFVPQAENWEWEQDNIDIAEAVAARLSLAIENAVLLEESQRRAETERIIGEITARISSSVNLQNVLQTAVQELGRTLPDSEVIIQLQSDEPTRTK
jgi:GAF domain-containing protein/HAMP domain-containing protein